MKERRKERVSFTSGFGFVRKTFACMCFSVSSYSSTDLVRADTTYRFEVVDLLRDRMKQSAALLSGEWQICISRLRACALTALTNPLTSVTCAHARFEVSSAPRPA